MACERSRLGARVARPLKDPQHKPVSFRLTDAQVAVLDSGAERLGVTRIEFMERVIARVEKGETLITGKGMNG